MDNVTQINYFTTFQNYTPNSHMLFWKMMITMKSFIDPNKRAFISPLNHNFIKFYLIVTKKVRMPPNVRAPSTLHIKRLSMSE